MVKQYIICVDDEKIVLDSLSAILYRGFGNKYLYEFAESAKEAIEIIDDIYNNNDEVVIVISDQVMPGMSGDQFLVHMHKSHPQLIKVLLTGQATVDAAINSVNNANLFSYLRKPWQENEIITTIAKGIEYYDMHKKINKQLETFKKFVPESFFKLLNIQNIEDISGIQSAELTTSVLFADLRGFTTMSETIGHKEVFKYLNEYGALISDIITNNKGVVEKFIGDGILSVFQDEGQNATQAAIEIIKALPEFNQNHDFKLKVGIGISSGQIILGTVGSEKRSDITIIGDTVNQACRIETITKFYECSILVSDEVNQHLPVECRRRYIDLVRLKGKHTPIKLFEILQILDEETINLILSYNDQFMSAIDLYKNRKFVEAERILLECARLNPADHIIKLYLQRVMVLQDSKLDENWDGIIDFNL